VREMNTDPITDFDTLQSRRSFLLNSGVGLGTAALGSLFPGSGEESYMILSVIDDDGIDDAVAMLRDVCEGFKEKGTGVVFTLPVTNFYGPV
jgi:hypothetical protein